MEENKNDKRKERFQLTELFMAKAGWHRCFHGIIKREKEEDGTPFVFGRIKVNEGYISGRAPEQRALGDRLDELVIMVLDHGLHDDPGVIETISCMDFNCN